MSTTICGAPKQSEDIRLLLKHSRWLLDIWVELYTRHYSHESLFILALFTRKNTIHPELFPRNSIHGSTINETTDTTHNILTIPTGSTHYSHVPASVSSYFPNSFSWRWNSGGPWQVLNIEWNTTMRPNNVTSVHIYTYIYICPLHLNYSCGSPLKSRYALWWLHAPRF